MQMVTNQMLRIAVFGLDIIQFVKQVTILASIQYFDTVGWLGGRNGICLVKNVLQLSHRFSFWGPTKSSTVTTTPQPFCGPYSGTTRVSHCQKRTSGLYGAQED